MKYLDHEVTQNGLKKTETKVKAIVDAPRPTTLIQLRSFIGMVSYYSKFVSNLAKTLSSLYKLLNKDQEFEWSDTCKQAFEEIKRKIAEDITLTHFDPNKKVTLTTDASRDGISAILSIVQDGVEIPVACVSRTLMPTEKNTQ